MSRIANAGQLLDVDTYQPRYPYGPTNIRVISCIATEDIPMGVMLQAVPLGGMGGGLEIGARVARDANNLLGVSVYDPSRFSPDVVFNRGEVITVCRRGAVFVKYVGEFDPAPLSQAAFYGSGPNIGQFTTVFQDTSLTYTVPWIAFSIASQQYYQTSSGSPAADLPLPVPPIPPGVTDTTFNNGVALIEVG